MKQSNQLDHVTTIIYDSENENIGETKKSIFFFHGKLIGKGAERPDLSYAPLLHKCVISSKTRIIMPEYNPLFSEIENEPKSLELGYISETILTSILPFISNNEKISVIAYSFGCIILAKLIKTEFKKHIDKIMLIAPVIPYKIFESHTEILSLSPTLIIWGTHDNFVKKIEKIKLWFPNTKLNPIEGGNHQYYLLPSPMDRFDENPATIARDKQIEITADLIKDFLQIKCESNTPLNFQMVENTSSDQFNLTEILINKIYNFTEMLYAKYDHSKGL